MCKPGEGLNANYLKKGSKIFKIPLGGEGDEDFSYISQEILFPVDVWKR
jgi:hypothetical protein